MALERMTDQEVANVLRVAGSSDLSTQARVLINELFLRVQRLEAEAPFFPGDDFNDMLLQTPDRLDITSSVLSSILRQSEDNPWTHVRTVVGAVHQLEDRLQAVEIETGLRPSSRD